jgi:hypothetical protein
MAAQRLRYRQFGEDVSVDSKKLDLSFEVDFYV